MFNGANGRIGFDSWESIPKMEKMVEIKFLLDDLMCLSLEDLVLELEKEMQSLILK